MTRAVLSLDFESIRVKCIDEALFVGAFAPHGSVEVSTNIRRDRHIRTVKASNHWLMGSKWDLGDIGHSYVNRENNLGSSLCFKGYVLGTESLHSASPSGNLIRYWRESARTKYPHNGVFSMARISDEENSLLLLTDTLGMAPLYFRSLGDVVLFATNPRFLSIAGDQPDMLAWKNLISTGIVPGDRTLTSEISRLPAGHALIADRMGTRIERWLSADEFADGDREVDSSGLREIENTLSTAVARCLSLDTYSVELPLSSGHDSRRILSKLLESGVDFSSSTVRVTQKSHRDLDAPIARQMSQRFGFRHQIIELCKDEEYAQLDLERQLLFDNETLMHTWAIDYMKCLPKSPVLILDGILGDILGNPGFRMGNMYQSPSQDLLLLTDKLYEKSVKHYLPTPIWPSDRELRNDIRDYLEPYMDRTNMPEFAFILLRQRRMTALWSHQLVPSGHLIVCPYLDLDYLRLLFSFKPQSKHDTVIQRACLERFWPELACFPGNRDIPANLQAGDPRIAMQRALMCFNALCEAMPGARASALTLLSGRARFLWRLSGYSQEVAARMLWLLQPMTELVARQTQRPPAWRIDIDRVTGS